MNTNLIHNLLNIIITIIGGLSAIDLTPFMTQGTALKVVAILSILKLVINSIRDGVAGMVANQPPVEK